MNMICEYMHEVNSSGGTCPHSAIGNSVPACASIYCQSVSKC